MASRVASSQGLTEPFGHKVVEGREGFKMAYRDGYGRGGGEAEGGTGFAPRPAAAARPIGAEESTPVDLRGPPVETKPAEAKAPDAKAPMPPAAPVVAKKGRPIKKVIGGVVLAAGLGFGAYEGYGWWTNGRFMVSTDD